MYVCIYDNIVIVMHSSCAGSSVIPIQYDGNCVFCIASYCKDNTEDSHSEIKLSIVYTIINDGIIIKVLS